MSKLIKLEFRKIKMRTYLFVAIAITFCLLGFIYLLAYAPSLEPNDPDMQIFSSYSNVVHLFSAISLFAFSLLSAAMLSKMVIEEFSGKRTILLFSYPISRGKILVAKILATFGFVSVAMFVGNLFVFTIWEVSEIVVPLSQDVFKAEIIKEAFVMTLCMVISVSSISLVALAIGFIKKSISATIISSVLVSSLVCNIIAGTLGKTIPIILFTAAILFLAVVIMFVLLKNVETMEV